MEYIISLTLGALASQMQGKLANMQKWVKFLISVVACVIVSGMVQILKMFQAGTLSGFDWDMFLSQVGVAFTASQTYYNLFFKDILRK